MVAIAAVRVGRPHGRRAPRARAGPRSSPDWPTRASSRSNVISIYSRLAVLTLGAKLASVAATLAVAFTLRSYWALVIGLLVNAFASMVLSYVLRPYLPRFSFARFRSLFAFSGWLTLDQRRDGALDGDRPDHRRPPARDHGRRPVRHDAARRRAADARAAQSRCSGSCCRPSASGSTTRRGCAARSVNRSTCSPA